MIPTNPDSRTPEQVRYDVLLAELQRERAEGKRMQADIERLLASIGAAANRGRVTPDGR